jgi:superfamily I DNA/RNA helicase
MLVVDEAQDLLEEDYLDVFDLLLKGGLAGGRWLFFGDFERQAIYVADGGLGAQQALEALSDRSPSHVKFSMRINCRNAEPIAETLVITSGLEPGYKRVLQDIEGSDVDPLFYSSPADQAAHLAAAITNLRETFRLGEIVVLSMRSDETSCAHHFSASATRTQLAPIRQVQDGQTIPYASIHAFKGLEAPAVIITDIESLDDEKARALLYVGMSRARIRLYMLMHENCRRSYNRILDAGLELTMKR